MRRLLGVLVGGPLEPYADGFVEGLGRLGYTFFSSQSQLRLAAHLSGWMGDHRVEPVALSPTVVAEFLAGRRAAGYSQLVTPRALVPLLGYLRDLGAVPPADAWVVEKSAAEALLERFRHYLLAERGLGTASARGYIDLVRPFVGNRAGPEGVGLEDLTAGTVTGFVLETARLRRAKTTQRTASALRGLLRFLHYDGQISDGLVEAVPRVADRREDLPRFLGPDEVARLLASCDRATVAGRRDFAMMILMVRLGLRAGEVAALSLGDVDWRRGELSIRGKGGRLDLLPVPVDVGEAIVAYLRDGRPAAALDRMVFVRVRAPHRGLTGTAVTQAVAAAAQRTGLGLVHAHRLRHSAATAMLRRGAPLAEVGEMLRHRRAVTTTLYAKVDHEALRALARPWPGSPS